ncbi:MAG: hypothetical protein IKZ87_01935 [Actinomycetaceae bacterium]|nr:hypothetical protein [Actinomycetaceae bacterium]
MKGTRHFAGVIGAAGIVVSPFMLTSIAQADETLAPDVADVDVVGAGVDGDVPNLPVTCAVPEGTGAVDSSTCTPVDDGDKDAKSDAVLASTVTPNQKDDGDYTKPVVSPDAAELTVANTGAGEVLLELPDEVKDNLPASGELSPAEFDALLDELEPYLIDGFEWDENARTLTMAGKTWTLTDNSTEGVGSSASQAVVDRLNTWVAQRNAGVAGARGVSSGSNMVGNAGNPSVADAVDGTSEEAIEEVVPPLPVTGDESAAELGSPAAGEGGLSLASLLGITGLAVGGGIGVITLRKRSKSAVS